MSQDWADRIALQLSSKGLIQKGICLILGAADTGKTTLAAALAKHLANNGPVGIVDADIGQSHIGPPATVGWAIFDNPQIDFAQLAVGGISFVGDVTPLGHLLQLTAAITQCVQQVSKLTELIIIDTPGFIREPAAAALWWTVQQILQPKLILAVQRNDELKNILAGLRSFGLKLELLDCPSQIPLKSPQHRQNHRQKEFNNYFRDSCLYNISLKNIAIQAGSNSCHASLIRRLVALRDQNCEDLAVGVITKWQNNEDIVIVRAPKVDIRQVRCLVVGDVSTDIADE